MAKLPYVKTFPNSFAMSIIEPATKCGSFSYWTNLKSHRLPTVTSRKRSWTTYQRYSHKAMRVKIGRRLTFCQIWWKTLSNRFVPSWTISRQRSKSKPSICWCWWQLELKKSKWSSRFSLQDWTKSTSKCTWKKWPNSLKTMGFSIKKEAKQPTKNTKMIERCC